MFCAATDPTRVFVWPVAETPTAHELLFLLFSIRGAADNTARDDDQPHRWAPGVVRRQAPRVRGARPSTAQIMA